MGNVTHCMLPPLYIFSQGVRYMLSSVRLSSLLSVTLVRLTQPVEIFGNVSTPFGFGTLAIR